MKKVLLLILFFNFSSYAGEVQAYLFITGPGSDTGYTQRLAGLIQEMNPSAKILLVDKFQQEAIRTAAQKLYSEKEGTSVRLQVIVNSEVLTGSELTFRSHEGEFSEARFTGLLREIDRKLQVLSVSFSAEATVAKSRVDTILLTSFSGKADCSVYPGGTFGITSSDASRSSDRMDRWVQVTSKRKGLIFPKDTEAWWEEWSKTSARSLAHVKDPGNVVVNHFWHCRPKSSEKIIQEEWL